MPLSEFYRSVNGKNEPPQQKPTDVSFIPNDEFVELICEKGQIMMQGQSSKARKTLVSSNFQFHTPKIQEKEAILDVPIPEMGLNQDDDIVPWLNYPLDDYCSDLLPEISGVTVNENPMRNKDSHNVSLHRDVNLEQSKGSKSNNFLSWSLDQVHIPDPSVIRSGASDIGSSNNRSKPYNVGSSGRLMEKMVQKQDSLPPYNASTLLNFSHFSRPAAMAKANLQNNNVINNGKETWLLRQPSLDLGKVDSKSKSKPNPLVGKLIEESRCVENVDRREDGMSGNEKSTNVVNEKSTNVVNGGVETEKSNEPIGATTSSVCSGNSVERASNDVPKSSKRKSRDTEDFECQSHDVEEESLGNKTTSTSRGGTGSKRSRAAEVHNLSERRRRDRINEKMRALQELIPNCNKVDKASMLDEAIEYLKTLQLQVQIMSMGTGLCMPPMMFPTGMHPAHVPHYSPMGMGMGMGMSYGMGMGMMDINGAPQGHPHMFPFSPSTQGSRHSLPTPNSRTEGIARSSFPVYGHPSQGMAMIFSQPPMPGFPVNPTAQQTGTQAEVSVANTSLNQVDKKDQVPEAGCSAPAPGVE